MRVAIALSLAIAARAAFPSRGRDPRQNKASAEQRKRAEREYYAPYKFYGRPLHLLTDVEWGNFERRSRKPRACALPADQGVSFYLFSFLRDDSPGLLAHFLRWYRAPRGSPTRRGGAAGGTRIVRGERPGCDVDKPAETSRATAGTWIFRGDESRRRRGRDVDSPRRRGRG